MNNDTDDSRFKPTANATVTVTDSDSSSRTHEVRDDIRDEIREDIIVPKDGNAYHIQKVMQQVSRICNMLAAQIIIGSVKSGLPVGAGDPIVQQIIQCAVASGAVVGMIEERKRMTSQIMVPPNQGGPRMGRA